VPIGVVGADDARPTPTGVAELDRVLGGGLVPGSVTLLAGEPGMGKSTLLLQALGALAAAGSDCLLVTAEESCAQVRARAERLGTLAERLFVVGDASLAAVVAHVEALAPRVLAVDSIQTVADDDLGAPPGSPVQVRHCAQRLVAVAKATGTAVVLVGHVTKDGALAGPKVLEHVVDTVLTFEGERGHRLRSLRALKHRFGTTDELGCFEMSACGLEGIADPSGRLLGDRRPAVPGSCVAVALEGARPLLVEVEAPVVPTEAAMPRRNAAGLDAGRVALVLAVLAQHGGVDTGRRDVYASVAGGVRIGETGIDLALALALAGARSGRVVPETTAAIGELGLAGEVRGVAGVERRLAEAARHGFTRVLVPSSARDDAARAVGRGVEVVGVSDIGAALDAALHVPGQPETVEPEPGRPRNEGEAWSIVS